MDLPQGTLLADLLLECQKVSYRLMEDLRQLQVHPLVANATSPTEAFMDLINRRTLVAGDPTTADGVPEKDLIMSFCFKHDGDHKPVIEEAERILEIYRSYPVGESDIRLPPPIWLRLLPICLETTRQLGLWGAGAATVLRFISFALEPVKKGRDAYETFVNINSDSPRLKIEEYPLSNGRFSQSLNRALFGSFYTDRLEDIGRLTSCVWWGIRFRTSLSTDVPSNPNWLDVWVDPNQPGTEHKAEVQFPRRITDDARRGLERLFKDWAFTDAPTDERYVLPLDTPSEQIAAYVKVNEKAFPHQQLPHTGMDCLICPGVFWSADPFLWGTGMTTVYGFEGYLDENISNLLLFITQQLMMAPTIYSQVLKLKESSERAGRYNVLHSLTKDIQATINNINRYNEKREHFLQKYERVSASDIPLIPSPDKLGVILMFLAAEDPHMRQLKQLPLDLANGLGNPWTSKFLETFVDRVVWDSVWGRVITDDRVKKALTSSELSEDELLEGESSFQRPELVMPAPIRIKHADKLYPLFLVALRSAYQHSYLHAIFTADGGKRGLVELTYQEIDDTEFIHIKNNGTPQQGELSQRGWLRDVLVFEGLTGSWSVELKDSTRRRYSTWREEPWNGFAGYWITTLVGSLGKDTHARS
jgi:hypothetical protein